MLKKVIILLLSAALVFSFTACAEKKTEEETIEGTGTAAEQETDSEASMDMVTEDMEFAEKLGMTIDTSLIPVENVARYVVDGEVAYFCFGVEENQENPGIVLLHVTKNPELKDTLSGLEGTATSLEDTEICGVKVSRKKVIDSDQELLQYDFEKDGIYYSLVTGGDISDETFTELFASFLKAVRPAE